LKSDIWTYVVRVTSSDAVDEDGGRQGRGTAGSASQPSPAEVEQRHRELPALGAEFPVAREDVHLAVVDDAGAAGGHPDPPDRLRHLGSALHQSQDLGVEPVD